MATLPTPDQKQTEIAPESAPRATRSAPVKLTVQVLKAMRSGDTIRDSAVRGFYAVCGARGVSLKVAGDLERGKTVRKTLGRWPDLELTEARMQASRLLTEIKADKDPRASEAAAVAPVGLTVGAAIDRYLADMTKRECATKTIQFTGARLRSHLLAWLDMPIIGVLPSHCQTAHERITASVGPVAANKSLRDFRAVWNLACRQSDDPESFPRRCPVASVTFHNEGKRADAVVTDLPGWWRRTGELTNPLRIMMFQLGLLSGLRPGNLAGIRREWIDLAAPTGAVIRFPASAMKSRAPFALPLSAPMVALVQRALELGPAVVSVPGAGGWLFPTRSRDGRSVVSTSNWSETTLAANECGHALRHTYNVLALTVPGVSSHDVERLLAHAVPGVAGVYYHADHAATEAHLRAAQHQITARILAACGVDPANVTALAEKAL